MTNQILSKFTFGFLMAQLFPGAIVLLSLTVPYVVVQETNLPAIKVVLTSIIGIWSASKISVITFLFVAVGLGMLIHGLDWIVLAWLENNKSDNTSTIRDSFWHDKPIWIQLLISPLKMVIELLWLLKAPGIDILTMEENAPNVEANKMVNFLFLQDFYLNFAQFYVHVSYASLIAFISFAFSFTYGVIKSTWDIQYLIITLSFYFLTSIMFIIGRVQLSNLFKAERELL